MKTFKLIWKMVFTVLDIILSIDSDGRKASRYSPLRANMGPDDWNKIKEK